MIRWAVVLLMALSSNIQDWGNGPVRWLMTKDEQRTWSKVQTDEEANKFIDLFWARRDPTEGTERNEFREEFERRVAVADQQFKEGNVRGAQTDRGRVLILLGAPKSYQLAGSSDKKAPDSVTFDYGDTVMHDLGLDRAPVFAANLDKELKIDPARSNVFGAMQKAVAEAVLRPDFTDAPEWAAHGGINAKSESPLTHVTQIVDAPKPAPVVQLPPGPHGASRLTFVKNLTEEIKPRAEADPFASAKPAKEFTQSEQLGYAFQLCREGAADAPVKVGFSISGTSGGKKVSVVSRPLELDPEPIRVMNGCSVVWSALPLGALKPGSYKLAIQAADPATNETWNLAGDFKVE